MNQQEKSAKTNPPPKNLQSTKTGRTSGTGQGNIKDVPKAPAKAALSAYQRYLDALVATLV